ncbi:hypothetical protein L227DRAFT_505373 [Lentinus tigrinus ALCF2SS1-6]|uniref:SprT-like domain-containing protein n=1 Tax=Lentinus tigrinus ALCF2SS1-6 TaxID=1328759 RepID=A0A5C2S5X1_9APHY|nr:hypothetical protein L227DRAFT_505373 [Lentinus tigrinus ALCF2SS1-6]
MNVPTFNSQPSLSDVEHLPPVTPRRLLRYGETTKGRNVALDSRSESENADEAHIDADKALPVRTPKARRRAPSPDDDVIDLTLSSPESEKSDVEPQDTYSQSETRATKSSPTASRQTSRPIPGGTEKMLPLFLDDSDEEEQIRVPGDPFALDDGAILTLDEPRSAQKPIRRSTLANIFGTPGPSTPRRPPPKPLNADSPESDSEDESRIEVTFIKPKPVVARARSTTSSPAPHKTGKAPRLTKKALLQLELERRRNYAQAFFNEMNQTVFGGEIPAETKLEWSKRLLTTAGRAHWKRTKEGVHVTSILLAEKILDCDERIRNTLSHEMCHLACWIINNAPTENHGSLFKSWAQKVMRKRPDIEVTTKHNYDIKYKYEWKCAKCSKIYGRHSKSINPEEHACGVCKEGQLVPQFESRRAPKTPKPKADSQNAAARSRDSPLHIPGAFPSPATPAKSVVAAVAATRTRTFIELSDGEDSDVEFLANTLNTVHLSAAGDS